MQKYTRIFTVVMALLLIAVIGSTGAQDMGNVLHLNMGPSDIPTLDPSLATDTSSVQILRETMPGLTDVDEVTIELEAVMATSWDLSDDGLVYTFHLLEDVPWVQYNTDSGEVEQVLDADGNVRIVTAHDFQFGMMRSMDPRQGSYYGGILATWVAGGKALNSSIDDVAEDAPDDEVADLINAAMGDVQITVIDDYTLEVAVSDTAAFIPNILGMWMSSAQPSWLVDEVGDLFGSEAEFTQSYGPFVVSEWLHSESATIVANPFWAGIDTAPAPAVDAVNFVFLDEDAAFANYEAGLLDAVSAPSSQMDRVQADPVLSSQLSIDPASCTYYYGFNTTVAPFDDVRVRRAFSMAVNRQDLIDNVLKGGQSPAFFFSRENMLVAAPRAEDYPEFAIGEDDATAQALLEEYIADNGEPATMILMHNESQGHANIAAAIQEMWRDTFEDIIDANEIQVQTQEWAVYLETIRGADTAPGIWRLGWCQDYPDAHNFLFDVFHSSVSEYGTGWQSDEFDGLLDQAKSETDVAVREELYAQAEFILTNEDAVIIPIYFYTSGGRLTQPYVERTYSQIGTQRYENWALNQ